MKDSSWYELDLFSSLVLSVMLVFTSFFSNIKNKHVSREEFPALVTMAVCRGFICGKSMVP